MEWFGVVAIGLPPPPFPPPSSRLESYHVHPPSPPSRLESCVVHLHYQLILPIAGLLNFVCMEQMLPHFYELVTKLVS